MVMLLPILHFKPGSFEESTQPLTNYFTNLPDITASFGVTHPSSFNLKQQDLIMQVNVHYTQLKLYICFRFIALCEDLELGELEFVLNSQYKMT